MKTPKRGRPKSKKTLTEDWLATAPDYLRMDADMKAEYERSAASMENARLKILEMYKDWQEMPDDHAYDMASLGHELLQGYETEVLGRDAMYRQRAIRTRQKGGAAQSQKAESRKGRVLDINKVLIAKIAPGSTYTVHSVAKTIHEQWMTMRPGQRLLGEPDDMRCRGDGASAVSVRTIERWLEPERTRFDKPDS